jgi:histidinol phosphatase-like enzyme
MGGLCSNQPGVGSGLITRSSARQLMQEAVVAAIGSVPLHTHIAMCTCPEGATCPRMKPNCGMLLELLEQYRVDSSAALYVGDLAIDEIAARRAGIPFTYAKAFFGSP